MVFSQVMWSLNERKKSINLELLASFFALKIFAINMRNCEILLRVDNTTAIHYINKMDETRFQKFNKLSKQIGSGVRKLWIVASYIPSKENTEADRESRFNNVDTEWKLSSRVFHKIVKSFGIPKNRFICL